MFTLDLDIRLIPFPGDFRIELESEEKNVSNSK